MIPVIGIVGGIGSGKSLVADALVGFGGYLIRADVIGHDALREPDIRARIVERWGDGVLNAQGEIDRRAVARLVFADSAELRALESIVHPIIEKKIREEIARARANLDVKCIILDAAILFEAGWHQASDKVLFVDAPLPIRLARLKQKRGWTEEEVARREKMQMPIEEKQRRADAIIVNDAEPEKVVRQVQDALVRWKVI
jgi:dephospho-CoA kinase